MHRLIEFLSNKNSNEQDVQQMLAQSSLLLDFYNYALKKRDIKTLKIYGYRIHVH